MELREYLIQMGYLVQNADSSIHIRDGLLPWLYTRNNHTEFYIDLIVKIKGSVLKPIKTVDEFNAIKNIFDRTKDGFYVYR